MRDSKRYKRIQGWQVREMNGMGGKGMGGKKRKGRDIRSENPKSIQKKCDESGDKA